MGGKSRLVSVTGVLLACCVAACGNDTTKGSGITQGGDHPDSRGTGHAGRHGGDGCGGQAGMAPPMGGTGGMSTMSPSPLPPPASHIAAGSMCEADDWCWYNPLPSGVWWQGVAGAGRTDLWIGGMSQNLLHFDGGRWVTRSSPLATTEAIWAASENDVWFGGYTIVNDTIAAAVAHWDGAAVTLTATFGQSEIQDVWGSSATDVYATGYATLQHWNGSAWAEVPGVRGGSVSGSGPNDVWVGTSDGMWHFDGTSWSRSAQLEGTFVQSVSAVAPGDAWAAVLSAGTQSARHFDGTNWTISVQTPDTISTNVWGIHASSPTSVWLVGTGWANQEPRGYLNHFDGTTWSQATVGVVPTSLFRVRTAPGFGDIAVGMNGGILRLDSTFGPGYTDLRTGSDQSLFGTWGSSPTDMWAVGNHGNVLHFVGGAVTSFLVTMADFADVWGTGPADVWTVGEGGTVVHFDGNTFNSVASGTSTDLSAVFTAAPNDVWIAGGAMLWHWTGTLLTPVAVPGISATASIRDLHGVAANDIWLSGGDSVGGAAFVSHYDGTAWSTVEVLPTSVGAPGSAARVWALAADDVWAVAERVLLRGVGIYWHFDGAAWTEVLTDQGPYVFPNRSGGSFVFGEHDRWRVAEMGTWQRSTR